MDYSVAQRNMVENQLRPNQVVDPLVLKAMSEIPREVFLPKSLQGIAYIDDDIPIGNGRHVMEPMVLARLLQAAEIQASDVVLEIGCGTGYSATVISKLASTVLAVESDPEMVAKATRILSELEIDTVTMVEGPLKGGCPGQAPFDVIFFNGAIADVPSEITGQLAEDGRLVAVVGSGPGKGMLMVRKDGHLMRREIFEANTPLLPEFKPLSTFVF